MAPDQLKRAAQLLDNSGAATMACRRLDRCTAYDGLADFGMCLMTGMSAGDQTSAVDGVGRVAEEAGLRSRFGRWGLTGSGERLTASAERRLVGSWAWVVARTMFMNSAILQMQLSSGEAGAANAAGFICCL